MPQLIEPSQLKKSFKDIMKENTEAERKRMIEDGVIEISADEFKYMISKIGYKIDESLCFNYYNTANSISYRARAMSYKDTTKGQNYAHFEHKLWNGENQEKLQNIRMNYFVFDKGRIWEL